MSKILNHAFNLWTQQGVHETQNLPYLAAGAIPESGVWDESDPSGLGMK